MTKIYVACLAAYNHGKLHGVWIDLGGGKTLEEVQTEIKVMLSVSPVQPAEEWAIHDLEGLPSSKEFSLTTAIEMADFIGEYDDPDLALLLLNNSDNLEEARSWQYAGTYRDAGCYMAEITDTKGTPSHLLTWIDWDGMAEAFDDNGEILVLNADRGNVHIFTAA